MGLDMYLSKKTYVKNWDHDPTIYRVTATKDGKPIDHIQPDRVSYVEEEVGYWRKANQIHRWFVENCQDGVDNCQISHVNREQLKDLLELCKAVKANPKKAEMLLPPEQGFFFGAEEIGDWYWENIDRTIQILEDVLIINDISVEYYYQSSW